MSVQAARPAPMTGRIGLVLALAVLAFYAVCAVYVARHTEHGVGPGGTPAFYDFSAFYQAGRFADHGQAALAYDDQAMAHAAQAAFPGVKTRLPWNYPPTFQLVFMPLAALPYVAAWLVWSAGLYALYAAVIGRLFAKDQLWLALLLPAAAINILVGQNGLLSATLLGGGVLLLDRRPWLAGALLGLLTYKPQFALLAPLVLLVSREWRAFAGASASAVAVALLALVVLGPGPWLGFVHRLMAPAGVFSSSTSDWRSIPSVQIMARSLGAPLILAALAHWTVALGAIAAAIGVWLKTKDAGLRAAALAGATLLVTPYLRLYDLVLMVMPIAVLLRGDGRRPQPVDWALVATAWLTPAVFLFAAPRWQVMPVVTVALLIFVARHAFATAKTAPIRARAAALAT